MDIGRRALRVPACARQMPGQDVALEHAAGAGERHPGRIERHHQGLELRHSVRYDRLRLVRLLELEPVEAVGRERDHVGQFADRGKTCAAKHLQGNAPLEGGEVEFGRLRGARQIGDAENDLVLSLPDMGKHRPIGRADERHGAAAERQR